MVLANPSCKFRAAIQCPLFQLPSKRLVCEQSVSWGRLFSNAVSKLHNAKMFDFVWHFPNCMLTVSELHYADRVCTFELSEASSKYFCVCATFRT